MSSEHQNSLSSTKSSTINFFKHSQLIIDIQPVAALNQIQAVGYVVELGSNKSANQHLPQARELLTQLCSSSHWSTAFVNLDYTASACNPKPNYTNQCGLLMMPSSEPRLAKSIDIKALIAATKAIECQIIDDYLASHPDSGYSRFNPQKRQVLIDIDVLALLTNKGVIAVAERYPFKQHEWVGIHELYQQGCFQIKQTLNQP